MRKLRVCLAVLTFLALVLTGVLPCSAEAGLRTVETPEDAVEWVSLLLGESPESLEKTWQMTDKMAISIALSGGMKALAGSLASMGKAESIGPGREGSLNGYTAFYVPCAFEGMPLDLILVMEQGKIAGLVTGAYSGTGDTGAEEGSWDTLELGIPVPALDGELPGTLTLPRGDGPFPAVVLVHGSGPNDRDETMVNLKPFRDLAEGLAEKGIAVYRYDKRTYVYRAETAANHRLTLVEETIEDAAAAVRMLAEQEQIDPNRIFVLGHSLGGNAVPAIDQTLKEQGFSACGYIFMAASPRPLQELMREQYDFLYSLMPEVTQEQQEEKDRLFTELDRLEHVRDLSEDDLIAGAYAPYWQWLADYNVINAAERITAPCLLLQGGEDYQVTMTDFEGWKLAFDGRQGWYLKLYPELTHAFTSGSKAEGPSAYARKEKVDERAITDIAEFVFDHGK